jgi:hypothetical protein
MSEAFAPKKTPEDLRLEEVLVKTIEAPYGEMKLATVVQDIERVVAAGGPEAALNAMEKLADPESGASDLVKALSSAWLARARGAVVGGAKAAHSATLNGIGAAARLHNGAHDTVGHVTGLAGGIIGSTVAHVAGGSAKLGAETGRRITRKGLFFGGAVVGGAAAKGGASGKKKKMIR